MTLQGLNLIVKRTENTCLERQRHKLLCFAVDYFSVLVPYVIVLVVRSL